MIKSLKFDDPNNMKVNKFDTTMCRILLLMSFENLELTM